MENKHQYRLKELFGHYKMLIGIIAKEAPRMVAGTFAAAVLSGFATTAAVFAGGHIFDDGLKVAAGTLTFGQYIPYIILFLLASVIPDLVVNAYVYGHVQERSQLILRTTYRGKMLQKLKRLKYAHFEDPASVKIMDMAFDHAEDSARHMFPMYVTREISSLVASAGLLWQFAQISPWLLPTLLAPFALDLFISAKRSFSVYDELQKYWDKERRYRRLGSYLRSRDYAKEQKLFGSSDFLIDTYQKRLNERNREYEKYYYFKHLKMRIASSWVTALATFGNAVFLLLLFIGGKASVGSFIALTLCVFGGLYDSLGGATIFFKASGFHIQFLDYYNQFFALSEDPESECAELPGDYEIEFRNVRFAYPNTGREILKGLSFKVRAGEKVSVVGENGEGKTTMIKLLLGLFEPDGGEILLGSKPLTSYSAERRSEIFAPIFQDFMRYSIPLRENIAVGHIADIENGDVFKRACQKAKVDEFAPSLKDGYDTLLGRDFKGGVDLSGGQWQRIALARAFMGDKPVLLLDEPTSQLDPIAESHLYAEFAEMTEKKSAIFITHRLASTMITDRILVISEGKIAEEGTHSELMAAGGIYARMFNAQKQWYENGKEAAVS